MNIKKSVKISIRTTTTQTKNTKLRSSWQHFPFCFGCVRWFTDLHTHNVSFCCVRWFTDLHKHNVSFGHDKQTNKKTTTNKSFKRQTPFIWWLHSLECPSNSGCRPKMMPTTMVIPYSYHHPQYHLSWLPPLMRIRILEKIIIPSSNPTSGIPTVVVVVVVVVHVSSIIVVTILPTRLIPKHPAHHHHHQWWRRRIHRVKISTAIRRIINYYHIHYMIVCYRNIIRMIQWNFIPSRPYSVKEVWYVRSMACLRIRSVWYWVLLPLLDFVSQIHYSIACCCFNHSVH